MISSGRGGRRTRRLSGISASLIRVTPAASSSSQNGRSRSCSGSEGQTSASSTSLRTSNSAARTTASDNQDVRAVPDERVSAEPGHQTGRRYERRHLESRLRRVRPNPHLGRTRNRLPAYHGRPGRDRVRGYVTVHQASAGVQGGPAAAITENARYLRSIGDFEE